MTLFRIVPIVLLLAFAATVHAEDSAAIVSRAKAAAGGERWDALRSWRGEGTMSAGGLSGEFHVVVDATSGRSADSYKLGSIGGADGYDGNRPWGQDPGGEVAAQDTPDALRRGRSQAWLDARGYWFPQRISATLGAATLKVDHGVKYAVITATPADGDPVTLWFDAEGGLLARVEQRQGQDTATTRYDDYREAGGVLLPFRSVTDLTDAAGRTDPRRRIEVHLARIETNVAVTDADFATPAMAATARIDDAAGTVTVPIALVNNHIYVDARIDGKPARLVVDTGGFNILTPAAARKFGIRGEGKLSAAGTGENRTELEVGHARSLAVGAATLDAPVFYIFDLGTLAAVEGVEFDGVVGYELFRRFGVQIDYAAGTLTIADPGRFEPPAGVTAVPFEMDDHQPIIAASLDGLPIRISIDTGSRSSLTVHSPYVRKNGLLARYGAKVESVTGWGVGGPQRGYPVRLGSLRIGALQVDGVAADLFAGDKGSFANPDIGANMGGGVLRRFVVAFDYAHRVMYLQPNAHAGDVDHFDRSGLWLLGDGDALKIADVADGSAGSRAALRANDRIVTIDGAATAQRSLPEWRQLLAASAPGTRFALGVVRDGRPFDVKLTLADRIPAQRR